MTRPQLRILPSREDAANLYSVPHPAGCVPLEHFRAHVRGGDLYPPRTVARLNGAARECDRATDAATRSRWAAEYVARWRAAEFERTGVMPPELPAGGDPAPLALAAAPVAPAPPAGETNNPMQSPPVAAIPAPLPQLDQGEARATLAPFLARLDAETAGRYVEGLPWPTGGALVVDPARHVASFHHRFSAELLPVLRALAAAWEDAPGLLDAAELRTPAAREAFAFEYSRLASWFQSAPAAVAVQVESWGEGITTYRHQLAAPVPDTADTDRCRCCKGREWWRRSSAGPWVCSACHPPARPELVGERRGPKNEAHEPVEKQSHEAPSWPPSWANLLAWLDTLDRDAIPGPIKLRPGVTITDPARAIAALRSEVARGPGGLRARRGLLCEDLVELRHALADQRRPIGFRVEPAPHTAAHPAGKTPVEHLRELRGHAGMIARGITPQQAHVLWDAARLWWRDRGTEREARWAEDYWHMWAKAQKGE